MNRENLMKDSSKGQNGTVTTILPLRFLNLFKKNNSANINEQLSSQNSRFANIHRMAHETQGVVENSNAELLKQREVMLKVRDDVK